MGVELLRRVCRRHDSGGQPDGERRAAFRLPAGEESSLRRFRPIRSIPSFFRRPIRRRQRVPDHLAPGPASGGGNVLSGKRPQDACSARRTLALPTGWARRSPSSAPSRGLRACTTTGPTPTGTSTSIRARSTPRSLLLFPSVSTRTIRAPPSTSTRSQEDFKPPTTDEFIVGVEREILSDLSVALAYTYRSVRNTEFPNATTSTFRCVGTTRDSYQYVGNAVGRAVGSDGFVLDFDEPSYALAQCSNDPCSSFLLENRPDYTETYNGLELQLVKRLSHGWMLRVGLRLQRLAAARRSRRHPQPEQPRGRHERERRGRRCARTTSTRPGSSTSAGWSSFLWASRRAPTSTAARATRSCTASRR